MEDALYNKITALYPSRCFPCTPGGLWDFFGRGRKEIAEDLMLWASDSRMTEDAGMCKQMAGLTTSRDQWNAYSSLMIERLQGFQPGTSARSATESNSFDPADMKSERTALFIIGSARSETGRTFPKLWLKIVAGTQLASITPHVLRHSLASMANDLGFTEATFAGLLGHAQGTVTGRYTHAVDTALISASDTVAGYIEALMRGRSFSRTTYAFDRDARRAAIETSLAAAGREELATPGTIPLLTFSRTHNPCDHGI